MRILTMGLLAATTALIAAPVQAVVIAAGTASVSLTPPTVTINPNTYTPGVGSAFFGGNNAATMTGNGGFASATGQTGNMAGTINFSSTVGVTLAQSLANFFVFNSSNNPNAVFRFSATSVRTDAYDTSSGGAAGTSNFALYLLGTTLYDAPGVANDLDPTPTSLTLTFNNTGSSAYSASATLSVPPTGTVPEPASWALMLAGFGLMGYSMRSARRKVSVNFG